MPSPSDDPLDDSNPPVDNPGGQGLDRRAFLKVGGLGSAMLLCSRLPTWAQSPNNPFPVPEDKQLSEAWVHSLFERGEPEVSTGSDLAYIGMPVGGICAGHVHLGGDGKLWHWDIFNVIYCSGSNGDRYVKPPLPASPLEQGFALKILRDGKTETFVLDKTGFPDIRFRGEYPIGRVEYSGKSIPVAVSLEAFSPFIPLNEDDSGLPATLLNYTVKNVSDRPLEATLSGWLQNAVAIQIPHGDRTRRNRVIAGQGFTFLECYAVKPDTSAARADVPVEDWNTLEQRHDFGTMGLALYGAPAEIAEAEVKRKDLPNSSPASPSSSASLPDDSALIGLLGRKLALAPGASATVTFAVTWHFPNLVVDAKMEDRGRWYANKFHSANAVAHYLGDNLQPLSTQTRLWRDTWYDSSLPYWFLDRTFLNTGILASSTAYRFSTGRFYGWEGIGSCAGTCTHVWHYAHAPARLFPALERAARELNDYNPKVGFHQDGAIAFRGEFNRIPAMDGQAGCILRAYREHQMSPDDRFLKRIWPRVKQSIEYLMKRDRDGDGLLDGGQHNTLDTDWYGEIAWLSGLYAASLLAGEQMALETGDGEFAAACRNAFTKAQAKLPSLFDGEYFINRVDPAKADTINSGTGCEIDQVFGQSWAYQVGLADRIFAPDQTQKALQSLWKYNFTPDVGPYRALNKPGRWYAVAGEAGLLMCTFPRPGWDYKKSSGKGPDWAAGYFNECMNGFEYQVAGHMIWEGLLQEGLAVTRAVHDRYHPSKRNPWMEIECGDYYARSMASYGVFLAVCGYEYHGPKGALGFAPKLKPEDFKAPFTTAEGWGSFSQQYRGAGISAQLTLKWGILKLKSFALERPVAAASASVKVTLEGTAIPATATQKNRRIILTFSEAVSLKANQTLKIEVS